MTYTTEALPFSNPTTSRAAAESQATRAPTDEARIISVLKVSTSTCDALERCLGLSHQTCSARIRGLVKKGRIQAVRNSDGTHVYAATATGCRAIVWEVRPAGDQTEPVIIQGQTCPEGWRWVAPGEVWQDGDRCLWSDKQFHPANRSGGHIQGSALTTESCIREIGR